MSRMEVRNQHEVPRTKKVKTDTELNLSTVEKLIFSWFYYFHQVMKY